MGGVKTGSKKIILVIKWYEANLKRDFDNITAGVKFICDGMVMAGVIDDDNRQIIQLISHEVLLDRNNPRIEVTVYQQVTPDVTERV